MWKPTMAQKIWIKGSKTSDFIVTVQDKCLAYEKKEGRKRKKDLTWTAYRPISTEQQKKPTDCFTINCIGFLQRQIIFTDNHDNAGSYVNGGNMMTLQR